MFDAARIRQDFSAAAPRYEAHADLQKRVLLTLAAKILPCLPARARLLDAGCGTGRLARLVPEHRLTQLDAAYLMCRQAANAKAPSINGTLELLPFADGSFDGVFSSLVLQWLADANTGLSEMRRVLKPGGMLAVSTFGPATLKELRESFAAVDGYPHVSAFAVPPGFGEGETVTEYYPDLFALMRHLKAIGARNKLLGQRKSLMTRRQMEQVERRYKERYGTPSGLPVTWEIRYCVTRKP